MLCSYSIVIPAYNEESHLPATLASAQAAMRMVPEPGEIVVVDNNSTDRTAAVARENGARVVFEPINQISRARNAGARASEGAWLVFLDADTQLPPGLLVRAIENLRSGKIAGGGALMEMDRPLEPRFQRVVNIWTWVSRKLQWAAGSFVYCTREGFEAVNLHWHRGDFRHSRSPGSLYLRAAKFALRSEPRFPGDHDAEPSSY